MAKAFSVLSWNVEHFGAMDKEKKNFIKKPGPIVDLIADTKADIVAIFEVKSDVVFKHLIEKMPTHQFFISEGPQMQEILIGVRKTIAAFTTQKTEFKTGQSSLRPGVLVTPYIDGEYYPLLFLHLKSMPDPKGFGLRFEMTKRAFDFRKVLKKAAGNNKEPNYMFLGDLNTMGMDYFGSDKDISADRERAELARSASRRKMRVLTKTYENTYWSKTYGENNLDHVVAAKHLKFKSYGGKDIRMSGWTDHVNEPSAGTKIAKWVKKYSDHALLYLEVQKV